MNELEMLFIKNNLEFNCFEGFFKKLKHRFRLFTGSKPNILLVSHINT